MQAVSRGKIETPVVLDANQPPTTTTWLVPWTLQPQELADPEPDYKWTIKPVQSPLFPSPMSLASLELRVLGATPGAVLTPDYYKKDTGPDLAQFRAPNATITQDVKLGGATKLAQVVVQAPGEARQPELIDSCGDDRSCLDLRRDDYQWQGDVLLWELPDMHISESAGSVQVSKAGKLQVFSDDHPTVDGDEEEEDDNFSFDTFSASVSIQDEPCIPGGPVVSVVKGMANISMPMVGDDGADSAGASDGADGGSGNSVGIKVSSSCAVPSSTRLRSSSRYPSPASRSARPAWACR